MAKIEIDENEYAELKRVHGVATLIGQDPKRRAKLQELVAEAAPDQVGDVPLLRREVQERLGGIEKKFDDFIEEQKKEREKATADEATRALERRWTEGRGKAREAGYTDEGLTELEAFMEKNGVADHELAIPAFERLHPPPEPVMTGSSHWNFFDAPKDDSAFKALMEGNDEAFLAQAVPDALKAARGGR